MKIKKHQFIYNKNFYLYPKLRMNSFRIFLIMILKRILKEKSRIEKMIKIF